METNRLKPADTVRVQITNTDGHRVATFEGTGFHSLQEVIETAAARELPGDADPRAFVFSVDDTTSGTANRYRLNAHGHAVLLE